MTSVQNDAVKTMTAARRKGERTCSLSALWQLFAVSCQEVPKLSALSLSLSSQLAACRRPPPHHVRPQVPGCHLVPVVRHRNLRRAPGGGLLRAASSIWELNRDQDGGLRRRPVAGSPRDR